MAETARQHVLQIYDAALRAVDGRACVANELRSRTTEERVYLFAVGKAACAMAQGAQDVLGEKIEKGLVITKREYGEAMPWPVLEAAHPIPDQSSLDAAAVLLQFVDEIPGDAAVLALISGGASALVELPAAEISLQDISRVTDWLLGSGLDIVVCNNIRKRLSQIKQGRLARRLAPRRVTALYISDVPDDDPATIGSGLLAADSDPFGTEYTALPDYILEVLRHAPPVPVTEDPCFANVEHRIVANLDTALRVAEEVACEKGYRVIRHSEALTGEARDVGVRLAGEIQTGPAGIIHIWGGETTVTLPRESGRGGRCQSLALAAAQVLAINGPGMLLAGATDGSDGPGREAGALVDHLTVSRGEAVGLDATSCLDHADAGRFLDAAGDLLVTGPTGSNVTDIVIGLGLEHP